MAADGKPAERTLLIPMEQRQVTDAWRAIGLKGTGSDHYAIEDLFVPAAHTSRASPPRTAKPARSTASPRFHVYGIGFSAIALGMRAPRSMRSSTGPSKVPSAKTAC